MKSYSFVLSPFILLSLVRFAEAGGSTSSEQDPQQGPGSPIHSSAFPKTNDQANGKALDSDEEFSNDFFSNSAPRGNDSDSDLEDDYRDGSNGSKKVCTENAFSAKIDLLLSELKKVTSELKEAPDHLDETPSADPSLVQIKISKTKKSPKKKAPQKLIKLPIAEITIKPDLLEELAQYEQKDPVTISGLRKIFKLDYLENSSANPYLQKRLTTAGIKPNKDKVDELTKVGGRQDSRKVNSYPEGSVSGLAKSILAFQLDKEKAKVKAEADSHTPKIKGSELDFANEILHQLYTDEASGPFTVSDIIKKLGIADIMKPADSSKYVSGTLNNANVAPLPKVQPQNRNEPRTFAAASLKILAQYIYVSQRTKITDGIARERGYVRKADLLTAAGTSKRKLNNWLEQNKERFSPIEVSTYEGPKDQFYSELYNEELGAAAPATFYPKETLEEIKKEFERP